MTNDRVQQLIDRVLAEAEQAVIAQQWDVVEARSRSILAFQPDHSGALAFLDAAHRATGAAAAREGTAERQSFADGGSLLAPSRTNTEARAHLGTPMPSSAPTTSAPPSISETRTPVGKSGDLSIKWTPRRIVAAVMAMWLAFALLSSVLKGGDYATSPSALTNVVATTIATETPRGFVVLSKENVCEVAFGLVREQLKSPSTARFPGFGDDACSAVKDTTAKNTDGRRTWTLTGTVDQKDGSVLMQYVVEVIDLGDGKSTESKLISFGPEPPPPTPTPHSSIPGRPRVELVGVAIEHDSVGTPKVVVSARNNYSAEIDALEYRAWAYDRFGAALGRQCGLFPFYFSSSAVVTATRGNAFTMTGRTLCVDTVTKFEVQIDKAHFTDGSTWTP